MISDIKSVIGVIAITVPIAIIAYNVGHMFGSSACYDRRIAEVAASNAKAELERNKDNEAIARMSDYDLCVSGLRASSLSIDACEQLRGLQP